MLNEVTKPWLVWFCYVSVICLSLVFSWVVVSLLYQYCSHSNLLERYCRDTPMSRVDNLIEVMWFNSLYASTAVRTVPEAFCSWALRCVRMCSHDNILKVCKHNIL